MSKDKRFLYCAWDKCDKKLVDHCFVCSVTGKYYCDDRCAMEGHREETGARRLPPQMFHEYPNDVTLNGGGFVKQVGRNSFNGVS